MQQTPRAIAASVLVPTALVSVASTALVPVVPTIVAGDQALAGMGVAALVVGQVVGALPGGLLSGSSGDRTALVVAGAVGALGAGLVLASSIDVVLVLIGLLLIGVATGFHSVARHAYVTDTLSRDVRTSALAWVSGMLRGGGIIGPFAAAGVLWIGLSARDVAYIPLAAFIAIAVLHGLAPMEVPRQRGARPASAGLLELLRANRGRLLQVAGASAFVSGLRSGRMLIVPLWGAALGLDPGYVAVAVGVAALVDFAVFPVAGWIMRAWSITASGVLSTVGLTLGVAALSLTEGANSFIPVTIGLGIANGLGSGYLLSVASVEVQGGSRTGPVLGALRTISDGGSALVPLAVGLVASSVSLISAVLVVGAVGAAGCVFTFTVLRPRARAGAPPKA